MTTETTTGIPERFEGSGYIVKGPRGNEFLLPATIGRTPAEAKRHLKHLNIARGARRVPFFEPVELVDVIVTIDRKYERLEAQKP